MKLLMAPHSGCGNRGCEAIVRGTVSILNKPKEDIFLYSSDVQNDISRGLNQICTPIFNDSAMKSISRWKKRKFALKEHLFGADRDMEEVSYRHSNALFDKKNTLFLSIGGDNYCYTGMQHVLSELTKVFAYQGIPGVLWGCSFEEPLLTDKVVNELKYYSKIVVRESLSFELLQKKGFDKNIMLCSDPAFVLVPQQVEKYDSFFKERQCIGINISLLMKRYNSYPDAAHRNVKKLIEHILKTTDDNILLIPHVYAAKKDDLASIEKLVEEINDERVFSISEDYNCLQLKYIISKCKMFIGCRTHATIAAYSTCVPTLAIAYSTKAKGIAKDLFDDTKGLLTDVREFKSDTDLTEQYECFCEREDEIRQHLKETMPGYIARAYQSKDALKN